METDMSSRKKKSQNRRPVADAKWIRDAARDFALGSAMLSKHFGSRLFPLRSTVVTHLFAIELFLKYLHAYSVGTSPEGHDIAALFSDLPATERDAVQAEYKGRRPLLEVLEENSEAFIEWRYIYEQQTRGFTLDVDALRSVLDALSTVADQRGAA
jgi:hypothetical protein